MSVTFKIKRRTSGATGAPSSLKAGELAYNEMDGLFYVGFGDDGAGNATSIKTLAKDDFSTAYRVPAGGASGQVLSKSSNADYALAWSAAGATYTAGTGITLSGGAFSADTTVIAPLASPAFTGTPTVPTASTATNTTQAASTAYVQANLASYLTTSAASSTYAALASPVLTGTPTAPTPTAGDNTTKIATTAFVQTALGAQVSAISWKAIVQTVATADQALTGTPVINGYQTVAGDRVGVVLNTTASQNGIYIVAAGAWSRATDMASWAQVPGATFLVEQGTLAGHGYTCTNNVDTAGTIGTTAITFVEFTGATDLVAGNGIAKTGNTLSAVVTGAGLSLGGSGVALSGTPAYLAALTAATDTIGYFNGSTSMATTAFTSLARSLVGGSTTAGMQTTLGLGSIATQAASAVAITGGTIDGITLDAGVF